MRVGLTGPIGAGKSQVAACWSRLGAGIVEGDAMGRRALESDPDLRRALISYFGDDIASEGGQINRSELARRAFSNQRSQRALTRLTFPTLYRLASAELARIEIMHEIVVFDAALIFEWGIESEFHRIVVVTAPEETLLRNSAARLGIDYDEASRRLRRQIPASVKKNRADLVIENVGTLEELDRKASESWETLCGWFAEMKLS